LRVTSTDADAAAAKAAVPARPRADSAPAFYKRRRRRDNEIGQVLLRKGFITPVQLRQALKVQTEQGGHVGAILRRMGACDARAIAEALIEQVRTARAKGRDRNPVHAARQNPSIIGLKMPCRPKLVVGLLFLSDLVSLVLSATVMWWLVSDDVLSITQRVVLASLVPLCLLAMLAVHLYEVTPPSPPEEIRRTTFVITIVFFGAWMVSVAARIVSAKSLSHGGWLLALLIAVVLVPIVRGILRSRLASKPWWGHAVVIIGAGRVGRSVVQTLLRRPQLGLKPVAILDDDPKRQGSVRVAWGEDDMMVEPVSEAFAADLDTPSERSAIEQFAMVEGVPVVGGIDLAAAIAQRLDIRTVVIAMPEMDSAAVLTMIESFGDSYTNVVVIPDIFNLQHFGAPTRYLGGVLGIEVQRQLMHRGPRIAKRAMDIALTFLGGLMILPLLLVLAVMIKLDSRGSVFYRQRRLGQDGVRFMALKFRTMHTDAEERLASLLESDPALRAEYGMFHKLTVDPRVTRIGKFLRKYSLDELPQVWNVLIGDMSLVGPRPYLEREIPEMAQKEAIVLRVKPGVTGIWQVTTRNESTFEERVNLDVEYVRNWSPWLDLYILARTVPVVIGGTGS
jgi:lipopolysaccharide/colanic/teichoic acid biosynthesis glycosyltransferase